MDLIIKSGSDAASVTFRRFDDGGFMVSFYDTDFMEPGKPDTVWTNHSPVKDGDALVERVRVFLFDKAPAEIEKPSYTMEQMFPPFRPRTPETDDEYYR